MDPGAIHPQELALGPRGIREREATALDSRKESLVSLSANHAPGAVPALDPCPRLLGGEDTEAQKGEWPRFEPSSGRGGQAWGADPYVMGPWHCSATSSSSRGGATSLQKKCLESEVSRK